MINNGSRLPYSLLATMERLLYGAVHRLGASPAPGGILSEVTAMAHPATHIANGIIQIAARKRLFLTPLQLIKLTYIAHGWSLALLNRALVGEEAEAWLYGPVFPSLYRAVKKFKSEPIKATLSAFGGGTSGLSEQEIDLLEQVVDTYGFYSGGQLSNLTHRPDTPWSHVWTKYGQNAKIPDDMIEDHYKMLAKRGGKKPDAHTAAVS